MGLNRLWHREIITSLKQMGIEPQEMEKHNCQLLFIPGQNLIMNLISISDHPGPEYLCTLQQEYQLKDILLLQLWEDVWLTKSGQVMGRIKSILGLNERVHGRKTHLEKITGTQAALFMDLYHIQGKAKGRYNYALCNKGEILAVAIFSHKRRMKDKGAGYTSAELIRFASKDGITVIGGLTKLLQHYVKEQKPDDIMSYADRDWSAGKGYVSSGFEYVSQTPALTIYLDTHSFERFVPRSGVPGHLDTGNVQYQTIFNTGSLKYIYYP